MQIQTALQSKAPGARRGEYSFVKVFPAIVFILNVIFIGIVLVSDAFGKTEYSYWMGAMTFTTVTLPVSMVPLIIQIAKEKFSREE